MIRCPLCGKRELRLKWQASIYELELYCNWCKEIFLFVAKRFRCQTRGGEPKDVRQMDAHRLLLRKVRKGN